MDKKISTVDDSDIEKSIHEEKIKMNYVFEELKNLPLHKKDKKINNHMLITKINKNNRNISDKPNNNNNEIKDDDYNYNKKINHGIKRRDIVSA